MSAHYAFPDPKTAPDFAPLACGGDLSVECLMSAYEMGIFPWFCENEPILWWSPNPRAVLEPSKVRVQKSIKPYLKRYEVKFDENFTRFIKICQKARQNEKDGTWISDDIVEAYSNLASLGIAHSVEIYDNGELIGGLYGLILGKVFCGESMLSLKTGASKVALIALCKVLSKFDFLIDCQIMNPHLEFMGATSIARDEFLSRIQILQSLPSGFENFKDLEKIL